MRLVHRDRATGLLRLRLDTPSDLWRIARIVRPGEIVGASTTRRDPEAPLDVAAAERSRRRVWLAVRAERVEFHGFSQHVRVTGPIVEGPFDIGRHQTLDLAPGDELTVLKPELAPAERAVLEEGLAGRGDATVLIAAVDWGDSSLVRLRGRSIEPVVELRRTLAGKERGSGQADTDRDRYVEELATLLLREGREATAVVLAGPGFLKERLARRVLEALPELKPRLRTVSASESGRAGVDELLRSGRAAEALSGSIAAEETRLVEELLQALASGSRAAVGPAEVGEAVDAGAVAILLVSEGKLVDARIAPILERAQAAGARLFIVREGEPAGRRLRGLGDIGAILRYAWAPVEPRGAKPVPPRKGVSARRDLP